MNEKYFWSTFKKKKWCGEPLYSLKLERYFFDNQLEDYLLENPDTNTDDLLLVICRAVGIEPVNIEDWDLYEDYELSKEVIDAVDALNELLAKQPPQCWSKTYVAAIIDKKRFE